MTKINSIPTYNYNNDVVKYKYLEKVDNTPEMPDKKVQAAAQRFMLRRNRLSRIETKQDKIQALAGAAIGTIATMAFLMSKKKIKNPFKMEYGLGDMLLLSAAPIVTGVSVGMIGNDAKTNLAKSKEGVFQFLNAAIPTWLAGATLKWCETTKGLNNIPSKLLSIAATILIGMHGAAALSNIICDPKDKHPDRKLTLLDSIANLDDLVGVLVLAKFPIVDKLYLEKLLPFIYTYCGYRAGKSN
ncbi:hypothetical protein IJD34_06640 [bacterium]|nr:hypothetical protein [bacterium]